MATTKWKGVQEWQGRCEHGTVWGGYHQVKGSAYERGSSGGCMGTSGGC